MMSNSSAMNSQSPSSPAGVVIKVVSDQEMLDAAYAVRFEVFVEEQAVPIEEELDALDTDPTTVHVLALYEAQHDAPLTALGTARLLPTKGHTGHFHIGRVAVRAEARNLHVGSALMRALEKRALEDTACGEVVVELSAQEQAVPFYEGLGYTFANENRYLDAGIWHRDMKKVLRSA